MPAPQVNRIFPRFYSRQERWIQGSTERGPKARDSWFRPMILNGLRRTPELIKPIQDSRENAKVFQAVVTLKGVYNMIGKKASFEELNNVAFTLEPLDTQGRTIRDPQLCVWNENIGQWVVDSELTREFYEAFAETARIGGMPVREINPRGQEGRPPRSGDRK